MKIPETMKAARFYEVNKPLIIEEVPVPALPDDEVLVQVKAAGLCGSDIHFVFEGALTAFRPIILGHESAGLVAMTGAKVHGWAPGARVAVCGQIFCGTCPNCISGHMEICSSRQIIGVHRNGGLAEYMPVPAKNLVRLPDNIPFTVGAIITDAVSTPFHALIDRGALKAGESIVIYGTGGLGLHALQIAKIAGAGRIIAVDVREEQLVRAKQMGANVVINAQKESLMKAISKATNGEGADVVADFVGLEETISGAVKSVKPGGRVVIVGLGQGPKPMSKLSIRSFVLKQVSLLGSIGFTTQTIERLIELIVNGQLQLEDSITHTFSLERSNDALKYLHEKIENPIRVVVTI